MTLKISDGKVQLGYMETDAADHCNFSCFHCSRHSPFLTKGFYLKEDFQRDVTALSSAVHTELFRFIGGEPMLHPELTKLVWLVRESGLADKVGIGTNGSLLHKADPALFDALDFIDVSLYPVPQADSIRLNAERIHNLYGCAVKIEAIQNFSLMTFKNKIEDPALVERIYNECWMRQHCNVVYRGHFIRCMNIVRKPQFLRAIGSTDDVTRLEQWTKDAVPLDSPHLRDRIVEYLQSKVIPEACNWCAGSSGRAEPWFQKQRQESTSHL